MPRNIMMIVFIIVIFISFVAGCVQNQPLEEPVQPDSHIGLLEMKYLYTPYNVNSERISDKIDAMNNKYGNILFIDKYDLSNGVPEDFKNLGYNMTDGEPSVIINGKLVSPFKEEDLNIIETGIKDAIDKNR